MIKSIIIVFIVYSTGVFLIDLIDYTVARITKQPSNGIFGFELAILSLLIGVYNYLY